MPDKKLFPGRTVYYQDVATHGELVATVVYVHSPETVNLWVLPDGVWKMGGGLLITSVTYDALQAPGTWHHLPNF